SGEAVHRDGRSRGGAGAGRVDVRREGVRLRRSVLDLDDEHPPEPAHGARQPRAHAGATRCFFFSSRRRHTRFSRDWSYVCSSDLLVTDLYSREQFRQEMVDLTGLDDDGKSWRRINFADYLAALNGHKDSKNADHVADKVAVVMARGVIADGSQKPGNIGGDSTAALLRKARLDDSVKAVVLRVDSPGGSGFASEIIRQEVLELKKAGKPVIASMSSVAASGGYWISASADEIWAAPETITGSIGVFGM